MKCQHSNKQGVCEREAIRIVTFATMDHDVCTDEDCNGKGLMLLFPSCVRHLGATVAGMRMQAQIITSDPLAGDHVEWFELDHLDDHLDAYRDDNPRGEVWMLRENEDVLEIIPSHN